MAPHRSCFALGAAVAVGLQGCGSVDISKHVTSMVGAMCKSTCENMVNVAEKKYDDLVIAKCQELKEFAHEHVMSGPKSDQLHNKCLDEAGAKMDQQADEQQANYTEQCIAMITNASSPGSFELTGKIKEFFENSGFSGDLDGTLDANLAEQIDKLKEEVPDAPAEEAAGSADRLRLFASGARIPAVATGSGALSCLLAGALAAAIGLTAVLRRRAAGHREPGHESLVDTEEA